jgi:hypothetical protein
MISIIRHKQDLLTVSVIGLSKQLYTKLAHGGKPGNKKDPTIQTLLNGTNFVAI